MSASDPRELGPLEKAVNDAAGRASVTWVGFLTLATYLAIATGSITHRDLFLEEPVTLPVLNVKLPLLGFFVVAPLFFLVSHFYALLQLHGLMGKRAEYSRLLQETVSNETDQHLFRLRLDNFLFLQLMALSGRHRVDLIGRLYRLVAWITMVGAPVAVLLLVQVTFLPYHHEGITWLHRLIILADVTVIWLLWPRVRLPRPRRREPGDNTGEELEAHQRRAWSYVAAIAVLLFSWLVARFPGEAIYPEQESLTQWLFEGDIDKVRGRPAGWLSNRLVLADQDFVDDEKLGKHNALAPDQPLLSMRGRNLRKAVLLRTDLRQADFSGAQLQGANFSGARLQKAWFVQLERFGREYDHDTAANIEGATFIAADLTEARLARVVAREATFTAAKLVLADLSGARLEGATFLAAFLTAANLQRALLQGSFWFGTQAPAAQLRGAQLTGATMWVTNLVGADMSGADLRAIMFQDTQLQGASLADANVSGSYFFRTQLQGADLRVREARSAAFCHAYAFRARIAAPASASNPNESEVLAGARFVGTRMIRALRLVPAGDRLKIDPPHYRTEFSAHQYYRFSDELASSLPLRAATIRYTIVNLSTGRAVSLKTASPRGSIRKQIERLSPVFQSPARDMLDRGQWLRLDRRVSSIDDYVAELTMLLGDLACDERDGPYVARGIAWSGLLETTGPGPGTAVIAARLRDLKSCPGARNLDSRIADYAYSETVTGRVENAAKEHCDEKLAFPDLWPPKGFK